MIEINNLTNFKISQWPIKKTFQQIVKVFKIKKHLSLALVDSSRIKKINKRYRRQDKKTDVLSFNGHDDQLGEIIISLPVAEQQAKKAGHSFSQEILTLFVHGCLHLLGYDHLNRSQTELMQQQADKILKKLKNKNV